MVPSESFYLNVPNKNAERVLSPALPKRVHAPQNRLDAVLILKTQKFTNSADRCKQGERVRYDSDLRRQAPQQFSVRFDVNLSLWLSPG